MYDKYFQATPITIGSKIPKHKGLLISGATLAGITMSVQFVNGSGNTFNTNLTFTNSPELLPFQIYAVNAFNGLTGFYVN